MSGSATEEVVEAAVGIINPGGDPDKLREIAKAWRELGTKADAVLSELDSEVSQVVGVCWTGEAADGFAEFWTRFRQDADRLAPHCAEVADNLDEAANAIEDINHQIHAIALEIGVTIALSVGMSYFTLGFSAAAGAARATQLAARAVQLARTLGVLLSKVAGALRALAMLSSRFGPMLVRTTQLTAQYA